MRLPTSIAMMMALAGGASLPAIRRTGRNPRLSDRHRPEHLQNGWRPEGWGETLRARAEAKRERRRARNRRLLYPVRTEVAATCECVVCGRHLELVAETEGWEWEETPRPGRWVHEFFGPAQGVCCERLHVVTHEGAAVYDLRERGEVSGG